MSCNLSLEYKKSEIAEPESEPIFSISGLEGRLKVPILSRTSLAATSRFLPSLNSTTLTLKLSYAAEVMVFTPSISLKAFSISLVTFDSTKFKSPFTLLVIFIRGMETLGNKFTLMLKAEISPKIMKAKKNISTVIGRFIASLNIFNL